MPPKIKFKPSNQSLVSRGLLLNPTVKKKVPLKPKTNGAANEKVLSESDGDKVTSMNHGLDRCASLLNAMMEEPQKDDCGKVKKKPKKSVQIMSPKEIKASVISKETDTAVRPLFNKRLVSSTPASESVQHEASGQESTSSCQFLLNEKSRLQDYLQEIQQNKKHLETAFDNIVKNNKTSVMDVNSNITIPPSIESLPMDEKESSKLEDLMKSIAEKLSLEPDKFPINDITVLHSPVLINSSKKIPASKHLRRVEVINVSPTDLQDVDVVRNNDANKVPGASVKRCLGSSTPPQNLDHFTISPNNVSMTTANTNAQLTTLKYLMKELRSAVTKQYNCDFQLDGLFEEIDHVVGLLPYMVNNTCASAEELVQPLQMENTWLKRKLKVADQRMKKMTEDQHDSDARIVLQYKEELEVYKRKLDDEEKTKVRLSNDIEEVRKITVELRNENQNLLQNISEKEMKFMETRKNWLIERSALERECTDHRRLVDDLQLKEKAHEKERRILEVSMHQRDVEIKRLEKLCSDLQQSVSNLLTDMQFERRVQKGVPHKKPVNKTPRHELKPNRGPLFLSDETTIHPNPLSMNASENLMSGSCSTLVRSESSTLLKNNDSSSYLSTLATHDGSEFKNELKHLDVEIARLENSLRKVGS